MLLLPAWPSAHIPTGPRVDPHRTRRTLGPYLWRRPLSPYSHLCNVGFCIYGWLAGYPYCAP